MAALLKYIEPPKMTTRLCIHLGMLKIQSTFIESTESVFDKKV